MLFILLISCTIPAFSQQKMELQQRSFTYFQEKQYNAALSGYLKLLQRFPKDPMYNYYSGICLFYLHRDLEQAINYLRFASSRETPRNVFFYLGQAYQLTYKFALAEDAYKKYLESGVKGENDRHQTLHAIETAENGQQLMQKFVSLHAYSCIISDSSDFSKQYNLNSLHGRIISSNNLPEKWRTHPDAASVIFYPNQIKTGDYLYFSALSKEKNFHRDIFRVKKKGELSWGEPENIGNIINTEWDEDYPYFDEANSTLYFCSAGHNSMGGLDIFKSVFNRETNTWTKPINMGFPVNSPYDDFLYIPVESKHAAFFTTNRVINNNPELKVFSIKPDEGLSVSEISNPVEIRNLANFEINVATKNSEPAADKEKNKPRINVPIPFDESAYNLLIKTALHQQIRADSLQRLCDDKRDQLNGISNETERLKIKKEIGQLQSKAALYQKEADKKYVQARAMEQIKNQEDSLTDSSPKEENGDQAEKNSNFQSDRQEILEKNSTNGNGEPNSPVYQKPDKVKNDYNFEPFSILYASPYSEAHPYPIDELLPENRVVYKIQLAVFSREVENNYFNGLSPISGETVSTQTGKMIKYYAGKFKTLDEAQAAVVKIRNYHYKDAYIVAFFNGEKIPLKKAQALEK